MSSSGLKFLNRSGGGACAEGEKSLEALADPLVESFLSIAVGLVMVVDENCRILAANEELLESLSIADAGGLSAKRPGDAFGCANALSAAGGCTTSARCASCGAFSSIKQAFLDNTTVKGNCSLPIRRGNSTELVEFAVKAKKVESGGHRLVAIAFEDLTDQKRREMLEGLFVHDLRNIANGLAGWTALITPENFATGHAAFKRLTRDLCDQIELHHMLIKAERGELKTVPQPWSGREIVSTVVEAFRPKVEAHRREVRGGVLGAEPTVNCDRAVLIRVLMNLVDNALDASPSGGAVTLSAEGGSDVNYFHVNNPGELSNDAALRLFTKGFTTKGAGGNGLGAYSAKLFTEKYLGGALTFRSDPTTGTTFSVAIPTLN